MTKKEEAKVLDENGQGIEGFKQNCEYMKVFIEMIKAQQCGSMPEEVQQSLKEMKGKMRDFLQEEDQGCKSKVKKEDKKGKYSDPERKDKVRRKDKYVSDYLDESSPESSDSVSSDPSCPDDSASSSDQDDKGKYKKKIRDLKLKVSQMESKLSAQEDKIRKPRRRTKKNRREYSSESRSISRGKYRSKKNRREYSSESRSSSRGKYRSKKNRREYSSESRSGSRGKYRSSGGRSRRRHQFDFREAPKLEKFREESGQDLERYLKKFEDYCKENYRGSRDFWLNVLEDKLEGKLLKNFQTMRDPNDDYYKTINDFTEWYKNSALIRKEKYREKFSSAKPKPDEGMYLFSVRLSSSFKTAYPASDPNRSKTLIKQFKKVIPRRARESLNTQIMSYKLKGKKCDWRFIQQCMRLWDIDGGLEDKDATDVDDPASKEVIISLSGGVQDNGKKQMEDYKNVNTKGRQSYKRREVEPSGEEKRCFSCGYEGHFSRGCWRRLGLCLVCGGEGHFVKDCPNKQERGRSNQRGRRSNSQTSNRRNSQTNDYGQRSFSMNPNYRTNGNQYQSGGTERVDNGDRENSRYDYLANAQRVGLGQPALNSAAQEFYPYGATGVSPMGHPQPPQSALPPGGSLN